MIATITQGTFWFIWCAAFAAFTCVYVDRLFFFEQRNRNHGVAPLTLYALLALIACALGILQLVTAPSAELENTAPTPLVGWLALLLLFCAGAAIVHEMQAFPARLCALRARRLIRLTREQRYADAVVLADKQLRMRHVLKAYV